MKKNSSLQLLWQEKKGRYRIWLACLFFILCLVLVGLAVDFLSSFKRPQPLPIIEAPVGPLRIALEEPFDSVENLHIYAHMENRNTQMDKEGKRAAGYKERSSGVQHKKKTTRPATVAYLSWDGTKKGPQTLSQYDVDDVIADLKN